MPSEEEERRRAGVIERRFYTLFEEGRFGRMVSIQLRMHGKARRSDEVDGAEPVDALTPSDVSAKASPSAQRLKLPQ